MGNKIKLDSKTTLILAGVGLTVLVGVFIFLANAFKPAPTTSNSPVVTKNESKTYMKYVALNEEKTASDSPTLAPSATATPTIAPTSKISESTAAAGVTLTPGPTEIILTAVSPTTTISAETTVTEPAAAIASLPTTGTIEGGILIFLVSMSMIAFAFVL